MTTRPDGALARAARRISPWKGRPQPQKKDPENFPSLEDDAWPGILGEIRSELSGKTEADPNAVLMQLLVFFGNAMGRGPHILVERDRHAGNLFCVLVGESARGRKGTSLGLVRDLVAGLDPDWQTGSQGSGLSTGEGLIWPIRDPRETKDGDTDPGSSEKRLCCIESEFGRTLRVFKRPDNILSALLRDGWDGRPMRIMTKTDPVWCREPHISIAGHITRDELRELISGVDIFNGLGNRFLWCGVRRGPRLPFGGSYNLERFRPRLVGALETGKQLGRMDFADGDARQFWNEIYCHELAEDFGGVAGALTARAEAQTLRLALVFSIIGGAAGIRTQDLAAGLAVWRFCRESAVWAFGQRDQVDDSRAAKIVTALSEAGPDGLTGTQIRDLFHRPRDARLWRDPLDSLVALGTVRAEKETAAIGRPTERYFVVAT